MQTILTAQDWVRLQEIFDVAVELPPAERASYLDEACSDDPALRSRIESLLVSVEEDTGIHEAVGRAAASSLRGSLPAIGDRLGPYEITGVVGQGGMGVVYRAVRADDEYNKEVAIKVAAFGLLTPGLRQRFLRERQILANLDHPNIAGLFDGGTTPDGAPFVVMEFVAGKPIDDYCAENSLARRARISLMIEVARAVDYAHRHLVVHRDLKPDNILVTSNGDPKLLDFGIAKALNPEGVGADGAQTLDAARLMTPDYASPEQVRGGTITTATDVYQLGVLLYLLLVGNRPFQAANASMTELERAICETPPPNPGLDADLDRILLQALEKDPLRRYSSAGALAEDLQRYLDGFPVQARRASWVYSTGKFVRRHRLSVAAASALALLLVGVSIAMTVLARRAKQQALAASQQARIANQTTDFLLGIFEANDPDQGRGDKVTARELLDKGVVQLKSSGEQDPVVRVKLLDSLGEIYDALGASQQAKEMLEESVHLRETKLPRDDVALADTLSKLGVCEDNLSNFEASRQLHERALSIYRARLPETDPRLADERYYLGQDLFSLSRLPEAESSLREAARLDSRNKGPADPETLAILRQLSVVLSHEGKFAEAYQTIRDVHAAGISTLRPGDRGICASWSALATAAYAIGRLEEAEQDARNSLSACLQSYQAGHPAVQDARYLLGDFLGASGKYQEGEILLRQALAEYQKLYGPTHDRTADTEDALGKVLREDGKTVAARENGEAALQARLKLTPDTLSVVKALRHLAQTDFAAGNLGQASQEIEAAIGVLDRKYPDGRNGQLVLTDSAAAEIWAAQGNFGAAEQVARHALDSAKANSPEGVLNIASAESALGWVYYLEDKTAEGCLLLRSALASDEGTYGLRHPITAQEGIRLAACEEKAGRQKEADALVRKYGEPLLASHDGIYRTEQRWLKTHPSDEPGLLNQSAKMQPSP